MDRTQPPYSGYTLPAGGAGGVTDHTALTSLSWPASGHTGAVTAVAAFDAAGAAQSVAATQDGQVLSRVAGALVWVTLAATVSLVAVDTIEYLSLDADALPEATAIVQVGVIA
jgi:hypothetical protein